MSERLQTLSTARAFDDWSDHWSDHYATGGAMGGRIDRFADALQGRVIEGSRILDYGCGTGDISRALASRGWQVVGCDVSAAMIEIARNADPEGVIDWAPLPADTPLPLPFESASFNGVVSSSVFEYLASSEKVIAEIARILAPDGWFLFTVPEPAHPVRMREAKKAALARFAPFWHLVRHTRWKSQYRYLRLSINRPPINVWAAMLADSGLRIHDSGRGDDPLALIVAQKPSATENDAP